MSAETEDQNVEIVELIDSKKASDSDTTPNQTSQEALNDSSYDMDDTVETSTGSVEDGIDEPPSYDASEFIYSGLILLMAFLFIKFINKNLWARYKKKKGKSAPQILITLLNMLVIICSISFISVGIFDQSLFGLITAGGIVGVGVAMALQGPILDFFSGIMIDVEGRVSSGDWVRLSSGVEGRVIGHNWRSITLMTIDNTVIIIANSRFSQDQYENISGEGEFWDSVDIGMDYNVPTKRVQRILRTALIKTPGVHNNDAHVFAMKMTEGGITYTCRYKMTDYSQKSAIRHNVIEHMISALHSYNLSASETLGEYLIAEKKDQKPAWIPTKDTGLLKTILQKTPIIKDLGTIHLKKIENQKNLQTFEPNSDICVEGDEGDSMYVILEGLADVLILDPKTGKQIEVATLGPADYFGEMALFMGDKRRATVRAKTSLVVLNINRKFIVPIIKNKPKMVDKIGKIIIKHLEANKTFLESLQEKEPDPKPPLLETVCKQILKVFDL